MAGARLKLRNALQPIHDQYEVILIDCPPALNMLTRERAGGRRQRAHPDAVRVLRARGTVGAGGHHRADPAAVNPRARDRGHPAHHVRPAQQPRQRGSSQLIAHFGDKVFRTIIPRNVRLAEAPSFGKPVLLHDKESRGALAYLALAGEMIRREEDASSSRAPRPRPRRSPPCRGTPHRGGARTPGQDPPPQRAARAAAAGARPAAARSPAAGAAGLRSAAGRFQDALGNAAGTNGGPHSHEPPLAAAAGAAERCPSSPSCRPLMPR